MKYSDAVLTRVQALERAGTLAAAPGVGVGEAGSLDRGTLTRIAVRVTGDTIAETRFTVFGCSAAIASASLVAERLEGAAVETAWRLTAADVARELALPAERAHVAQLAVEAAAAAVADAKAGRAGAGRAGAGNVRRRT